MLKVGIWGQTEPQEVFFGAYGLHRQGGAVGVLEQQLVGVSQPGRNLVHPRAAHPVTILCQTVQQMSLRLTSRKPVHLRMGSHTGPSLLSALAGKNLTSRSTILRR
eukprot:scaffold256216_cov33-Prasinocladus_malaysianus.AAC.1